MPTDSKIARRNRALIAFTLLTGARDSAAASLKLKHVDMIQGQVFQDAREVKTKRSKTFYTYFFPVGEEVLEIVAEWVEYLRNEKLWGNDDPLFPSTRIAVGLSRHFEAVGVKREHCFRKPLPLSGCPITTPTASETRLCSLVSRSARLLSSSRRGTRKKVLTTFFSYGEVAGQGQGEIIRDLAKPQADASTKADDIAEAVIRRLQKAGIDA